MRFLLVLVGLAALVLVVAMSLGWVNINQTRTAELPHLTGGSAPAFKADVAKVNLGLENKTVDVPTVTTTQRTVAVPTLSVDKPGKAQ